MNIPVNPSAATELAIPLSTDQIGADGRHHTADDGVEKKGEDRLVRVERESRQMEDIGDRLNQPDQRFGWVDGEWVAHVGERAERRARRAGKWCGYARWMIKGRE